LTGAAIAAGCVGLERRRWFERRAAGRAHVSAILSADVSANAIRATGADVSGSASRPLAEWLRVTELAPDQLARLAPLLAEHDAEVIAEATVDARYAPYLARQQDEIGRRARDGTMAIPERLEFDSVPGLSREMVERLERARPETLDAASRVRGITPAALAAILVHSRRIAA
ncbi:MAG: tRNA uridine 5-carboxymethylaminomethyl modification enzyme GidA, partial [Sphingomonas bacterium]|nr:tRNA uridine 5-carboxymethylaminomethyl modification enzyme GidA [Sphingomonas bacterium]